MSKASLSIRRFAQIADLAEEAMPEKEPPLFIKWYAVLSITFGLLFLILFTAHALNFYHPFMDILVLGYTVITIANCVFGIPTVVWMFATMGREYHFKIAPVLIPVQVDESFPVADESFPVFEPSPYSENWGELPAGEYIYIIQDLDVTGYCKIGKTNKPFRRIKTFNVKLPFRHSLIHIAPVDNRHEAERFLHRRFANKRIRGEWFALTAKDIARIQSLDDSNRHS